jgi:putative transcriptional regulator
MTTKKRSKEKRTKLGLELEEAFKEMAAHLRGELEVPSYDAPPDVLTPKRIKAIRQTVAASTKEFERMFGIPARTMESYEQGRRRLDGAMRALLRIIEREPEAARRAFAA